MEIQDLVIGNKYNWKNQDEKLVYLGFNFSGNGYWHQFAKVDDLEETVWCEVQTAELEHFELTNGIAVNEFDQELLKLASEYKVHNHHPYSNNVSTHKPTTRKFPKVGRNSPCPCGSKIKYKRCCA